MSSPINVLDTPFEADRGWRWSSLLSPRAVLALSLLLVIAGLVTGNLAPWLVGATIAACLAAGLMAREHRRPAGAVVLIGRTALASVIGNSLESGLLTPGRKRRPVTVHRAQNWSEATDIAGANAIDEIIVAEPMGPNAIAVRDARGRRPKVVNGGDKLEGVLGRIPLELAAQDRWFNRLGAVRPVSLNYQQTKRVLDLCFVAAVGVAVLPALPLIALAIKLDSRGPVLYSQQRVGLGGRTFRIYKFRSMRQDAERNGAVWAQKADPRITRVGRFMRLTRIDEIPQIWNVLRGEMTVVGPRPERPEFTVELAKEIHGYDLRHTVKPGLTGWAQVCYRYTSSVRDTKAKVEYDLYYVKHLSTMMDIRILFRTIKVVLGMKGQ